MYRGVYSYVVDSEESECLGWVQQELVLEERVQKDWAICWKRVCRRGFWRRGFRRIGLYVGRGSAGRGSVGSG